MNASTPATVFRKGKKVVLRPLQLSDATLLTTWINDPEITRFLARVFPMTLLAEEEWLRGLPARSDTDVVLMIATREDVPIGTIGLHHIDWVHRRATTGTLIGNKEYQGKGYGTDAKMLLLDFAFNRLGLLKICSHVHDFNGRSLRYSEKCGYVEEGRLKRHNFIDGAWHDEVQLAVFRDTWLPLWEEYTKP